MGQFLFGRESHVVGLQAQADIAVVLRTMLLNQSRGGDGNVTLLVGSVLIFRQQKAGEVLHVNADVLKCPRCRLQFFHGIVGSGLDAAERPNIVFVFIDDMGWGDFSCFGNTEVSTENIDRLAAEGLRFEQFYVNSPSCSPSRTAI